MKVPPFSLESQLSLIGPELETAVLRVLKSGQYIGGEEVESFEKSFAELIGVPYVVGCNSGTDALVLALRALDIGPGDEVITTAFSFFATAEAITSVGAKPVFVDVSIENYLIDLNKIEKSITKATKAILPVHLFGRPVDMDVLMNIARKYKLKVVEDCAQACGAKWNGKSVGFLGDIGCFSFFPTKNLGAAGDAGAISTHDPQLGQRIRELAVHGMPRRYVHTQCGYNSRLDALQAAVLNVKLSKLSDWITLRNNAARKYQENLSSLPGIQIPVANSREKIVHGWNQFVIRVKENFDFSDQSDIKSDDISSHENKNKLISLSRDELKKRLSDFGINTIIYYPIPIHLQAAYKELGYLKGSLPITEKLCDEVLSLPIFPEITKEQQQEVINVIKHLFQKSNHNHLKISV